MKFSDMPYERIELPQLRQEGERWLTALRQAQTAEQADGVFSKYLRCHFMSIAGYLIWTCLSCRRIYAYQSFKTLVRPNLAI